MLLFLITNTFSVYFTSQCLQMSAWISEDAHLPVTPFSLIYDALYALLVVLGIHQLSCITKHAWTASQMALYSAFCHLGAIGFALGGQIPCIKHFNLTHGFWSRLSFEGKLVIGCLFLLIVCLVYLQLKRAVSKNGCRTQFTPWCMLAIIWVTLWSLIHTENIEYTVHVHHALFAGLFACWFRDFTSRLDIVVNAVFVGIVIEGIDFYGIGELTLFIIHTQKVSEVWPIWTSLLCSAMGLLLAIYMRIPKREIINCSRTRTRADAYTCSQFQKSKKGSTLNPNEKSSNLPVYPVKT
jgi:hypothetical protein